MTRGHQVKRQIVRAPRTAETLQVVATKRINRSVTNETEAVMKPCLLPKLEHFVNVRVDSHTRKRLDDLILVRDGEGLRLTVGDLGRQAILRYLDEEEAKLQQTSLSA